MTKRIVLSVAAALLTVTPALADTPAARPKWTGCSVGVGAGMVATVHEASLDVPGGSLLAVDGLGSSGASLSAHVGCDLQLQHFVVGAFADYTWHNQSWTARSDLIGGPLATFSIDTQWTVGARAGVVINHALLYGLVGYTQMQSSALSVPLASASFSIPDHTGIVFGGGLEMSLGNGLFLTGEYRYTAFDREAVSIVPGLNLNLAPEMHTAMARISYRFGMPGQ